MSLNLKATVDLQIFYFRVQLIIIIFGVIMIKEYLFKIFFHLFIPNREHI